MRIGKESVVCPGRCVDSVVEATGRDKRCNASLRKRKRENGLMKHGVKQPPALTSQLLVGLLHGLPLTVAVQPPQGSHSALTLQSSNTFDTAVRQNLPPTRTALSFEFLACWATQSRHRQHRPILLDAYLLHLSCLKQVASKNEPKRSDHSA